MEREREKGISDNVVDAFPFVLLHLKDNNATSPCLALVSVPDIGVL